MAGGLDKHAGDGRIKRKARWINKQMRDESSTRDLGVRES